MEHENEKKMLCKRLFEIGAVKFGLFTLKSGLKSPIYIDLRVLVSYPDVLRLVARQMKQNVSGVQFDRIAGIPYAAIPFATALSLESGWPMIYTRKEAKEYGTKKMIEGEFKEGDRILVIDDLITNGSSKFDVIKPLEEAGMKITDIAVLIDREQGGKKELASKGYQLHAVITIHEMLEILKDEGKIPQVQYQEIKSYFDNPEKWGEGK